jgi:hypothetical protein
MLLLRPYADQHVALQRNCLIAGWLLRLFGMAVMSMMTMALTAWLALDDREIRFCAFGKCPLEHHVGLAGHGVLNTH